MSTQSTLTRAAEKRAATLIYFAAFSFVMMIGSMQVLVPLYGLFLGYDIKALGFIISAQAVLPLFSRFFAGALADMFGDRWVLVASFAAMTAAAVTFTFSEAFWTLIVGQVFQGVGRSAYHTVAQSYASRINPELAATRLGRLSSSGNGGSIISTAAGGFLAAAFGFTVAFGVFAVVGVFGTLGAIALPFLPSTLSKRSFKAALAPIPQVAKTRAMGMAAVSAFVGSSAMMLGIIMIIPFLKEAGFGESEVGIARTFAAVGSLTTGLFFGFIVNRIGLLRVHVLGFALQGLVLLFIPLAATELWSAMPAMFVFGLLSGVMGGLYPTVTARFSLPEHRGTGMAYSGQFWGLAQLVIPTTFGFIAAAVGLGDAIRVGGIMLLVASVAVIGVYPWLTKHGATVRRTG
ncbi:MAG: MFS transporter [Chloroflexi bacterium]|nr:MFS transporter [Chloroflexota bacterium]